MRIRTGWGPDDWTESVPAAARLMGHGGRMVGEYIVPKVTTSYRDRKPLTTEQREVENERRRQARASGKP